MSCKYMTIVTRGDSETYYCSIGGMPCGHPYDDACLKPEWFEPLKKNVKELEDEFKKVYIRKKKQYNVN